MLPTMVSAEGGYKFERIKNTNNRSFTRNDRWRINRYVSVLILIKARLVNLSKKHVAFANSTVLSISC